MRTIVLFIQGGGEGAHDADLLLSASLQKALGTEYDVRYPRMPEESNPNMQSWKAKIGKESESLEGGSILVGHSLGGAALLKYLSEERIERPIAGLFLLAVPTWDEENWNFDEIKLPSDLATKLLPIPHVFLYRNRDDEIVPFQHLALLAARLPHAIVREGDRGGHQFDNDLAEVASDIKEVTASSFKVSDRVQKYSSFE